MSNKNNALNMILSEISYPVYFDEGSQKILDNDGKMLLDVRGWGWLQKFENGSEMQDAFGEEVCKLINANQPVCPQCNTKNYHFYPNTNRWVCAFC